MGVALLLYGGVDFQILSLAIGRYGICVGHVLSIYLQEISSTQTIRIVNPCQHNNVHMYFILFQTYCAKTQGFKCLLTQKGHFIGPNIFQKQGKIGKISLFIGKLQGCFPLFCYFSSKCSIRINILSCVVKIETLTSVFCYNAHTHCNQVLKMTELQNANKENLDSLDISSLIQFEVPWSPVFTLLSVIVIQI